MTLAEHTRAISLADAPRAEAGLPLLAQRVVDGEAWDWAVSDFDGVCQEQLFAYARRRWPGVELEPVLFSEGKRTLGGAMVMLQRLPAGLATVALVKWGPFLADADLGEAALARMIDALVAEYADRRGMMVSIMPRAEPGEDNKVAAMLAARGFRPGVGVKYPLRYVVDVTPDDHARLAGFGQKWRYNLRKSMKAGLDFEIAPPSEIGRFMALYRSMSERKLFPDFSGIDTLQDLMNMPEGTARPELFFVKHGARTVAGAVVFSAGETAAYLYGATDDAALDLRAGYFLHWEVIRWLRDNSGARFYDLGGSDGFAGLHQFKTGMVGTMGHISPLPPVMNYASHWRAYAAGTAAYKAREVLTRSRDRVLAARLSLQRRFKRGAV